MSIIKSFSVGNGDMFYIRHGADSFSVIDCCMNEEDRKEITEELKYQSRDKTITRFISTHPDYDHIRGLAYLNGQMPIVNFYCVANKATKKDETDDFREYRSLRDSDKAYYLKKGCSRKWLNESDNQRGGAGIHILWPDTGNQHYKAALKQAADGGSPNNISPIIRYSLEHGVTALWMGDLETDFMEAIGAPPGLGKVDVLFAPHHGRKSGRVPKSWLDILNPGVVVVGEAPSEDLHYYGSYNTIKQNSAGTLLFECVQGRIDVYVESSSYSESFLESKGLPMMNHGMFYIGSLNCGSGRRV